LIEARRTAVLAVPGVGELVGEQVGVPELMGVIGEALFAHAVVGGLAVLEALAAGGVAEREQEVVLVVVVRLVHRAGFTDEVIDLSESRGTDVNILGLVGDYVEEVLGRDLGGKSVLLVVEAGIDGGVFELLDGGGGEVVAVARSGAVD
jgi:hypothetical protein